MRAPAAVFAGSLFVAFAFASVAGASARVSERFVPIGSAKLYVKVIGSAPGTPLLILNGGPGFPHDYILKGGALERMAARRRVVVFDQRGTGRSSPMNDWPSCTAMDNVSDVEAVRASLGAERVDVYGHSWGGLLAMLYVEAHPEHVRKLVIADAAAPKFKDTPFRFDEFFPDGAPLPPGAEARGDTSRHKNDLESYFALIFVSPAVRERFIAEMRTAKPAAMDVNKAVEASLDSIDAGPGLANVTCPTLVVTGRYDTNVAPMNAWKIHRAIAGSRWHVFEVSSHMPLIEEPAEFVRVMEDFYGAP